MCSWLCLNLIFWRHLIYLSEGVSRNRWAVKKHSILEQEGNCGSLLNAFWMLSWWFLCVLWKIWIGWDVRINEKSAFWYVCYTSMLLWCLFIFWFNWIMGWCSFWGIKLREECRLIVTEGGSLIYNRLYPFEGLQNYTSRIIHHVQLTRELAKF